MMPFLIANVLLDSLQGIFFVPLVMIAAIRLEAICFHIALQSGKLLEDALRYIHGSAGTHPGRIQVNLRPTVMDGLDLLTLKHFEGKTT